MCLPGSGTGAGDSITIDGAVLTANIVPDAKSRPAAY